MHLCIILSHSALFIVYCVLLLIVIGNIKTIFIVSASFISN